MRVVFGWQIGVLTVLLLCSQVAAAQNAWDMAKLKVGEELVVVPRASLPTAVAERARRYIERSAALKLRRTNQSGMQVYGRSVSTLERGKTNNQNISDLKTTCAMIMKSNPALLCEPNYIYHALVTSNDPMASHTWGLSKISLPSAWATTTGSKSILVAVIDTGIDYTHPDLSANMSTNTGEIPENGMDDDGNGYIDDYYGYDFSSLDGQPMDENEHGTHVAGTIGAVGNNNIGVAGVNWSVSLLAVRVLDANGEGTLEDVASGVDYARARGAQVMNLSLGGPYNSWILEASLQQAGAAGAVIAVAAGNESANNDYTPSYPANCNVPEIISVAATDSSDALSYFSNYGAVEVDLAAPGEEIASTIPGGGYASFDGTSMASPHVAGVAALVKSAFPAESASQIRQRIISGVDPIASLQGRVVSGGRLNAYGALQGTTPPQQPTPVPTTVPYDPGDGSTPDPDSPEDSSSVIASLLVYRKTTKAVQFYGYLYDAESELGLADESVQLLCAGKAVRSTYTDEDGLMYFGNVKKGAKAKSCYVHAPGLGVVSNSLKVPKRR